jgi:DNA-binding GntR family transcriptional regulator
MVEKAKAEPSGEDSSVPETMDKSTPPSTGGAVPLSTSSGQPNATLAERLCHDLERAIIDGTFPQGMRLDEKAIADRFGVSRTPVREAFRMLAVSGLVEMRSHQGAVVSAIMLPRLIEMFQVMAELEGLCARLASRRATPQQVTRMREIHERLARSASAHDPDKFYEINCEFHEAIYDASQNTYLAQQTRALRNRIAAYRRRVTDLAGRVEGTVSEHQTILDAIARHDGEAAHAAMRAHVGLLGDVMSDFIAAFS